MTTVAEALQAGLAVSIAPVTKTLTTQQAAELIVPPLVVSPS